MADKRRDLTNLLADDSHGETHEMPAIHVKGMSPAEGKTRGLHRIAGGVMFDTAMDQPSTARSTPRGRAVADSRSPTAKRLVSTKQRPATKRRDLRD